MNRHEIITVINQTLEEVKENLKGHTDIYIRLTDGDTEGNQSILFSVAQENGRIQVFKIMVVKL
jgi:ribulose bisphosphate carboxylase small subunit